MSFKNDLFFIFNKSNKVTLIKIQLLMIISAVFELFTIISIIPLMKLLVEINLIFENKYLNLIYNNLNFKNTDSFLIFTVLTTIFLFTTSTLLILYTRYSVVKFNQNFLVDLGTLFFKKYLNMNYSFYISESSSVIIRNLHDDLSRLISGIIQPLMNMTARLILILFISVSLLIYEFKITSILFIILIFSYLLIFNFVKQNISKYGILLSTYSSEKIKLINETFLSIKNILISNNQNYFVLLYEKSLKEISKAYVFVNLASISPRYLIDLIGFTFILCLILFLKLTADNNLESIISTITFLVFASYKLIPSFQEVYSSSIQIKNNKNVLSNIKHMFNDNIPSQSPILKKNISLKNVISFKNLSFKYSKRSKIKIFDNASIDIKIGKTNAFIGSTGVGKSTLMEIILGLHEFDVDHILIDGKNFNKKYLNSLWNQISYVPQNSLLIDDTILSNICFAKRLDKINYKKLKLALKISQLTTFVDSLPNNLSTIVGEKGVQLSGGQQQRISIARAIYQDRNIIFLDESMSALDEHTELKILKSIKSLKNKTILMITHRLETVSRFDNVFIIKNKKIIKKN